MMACYLLAWRAAFLAAARIWAAAFLAALEAVLEMDPTFTMQPSPAVMPAAPSPPIFAALAEVLISATDAVNAISADVVLNNVFIIMKLRC